ncbi:MAG TPA: hypothetical protein VMZ52_06415 [Bryobacteraceae bacterium]|nr:hypothetical protein [Bryobacteraceae bacterium]
MPNPATYDDVNLILRLYEMRREDKMRLARQWFAKDCKVRTMEDLMKVAPLGEEANAYFRMVTSYWEMVASFITSGVLNEDLFFQSGLELLFCWERIRDVVPGLREMFKNPNFLKNLEAVAAKFIQKMGPETYQGFSARVRG